MQALTVHHYWAWAISQGIKRVENRPRWTAHRGPLAIHAGVSHNSLEASRELLLKLGHEPPTEESLTFGAIIAVVDLVDVVEYDPRLPELLDRSGLAGDPFATGPVCYILANPRPLITPIACRGMQGFWKLPADLAAQLTI